MRASCHVPGAECCVRCYVPGAECACVLTTPRALARGTRHRTRHRAPGTARTAAPSTRHSPHAPFHPHQTGPRRHRAGERRGDRPERAGAGAAGQRAAAGDPGAGRPAGARHLPAVVPGRADRTRPVRGAGRRRRPARHSRVVDLLAAGDRRGHRRARRPHRRASGPRSDRHAAGAGGPARRNWCCARGSSSCGASSARTAAPTKWSSRCAWATRTSARSTSACRRC